jgi:hypothetical protein
MTIRSTAAPRRQCPVIVLSLDLPALLRPRVRVPPIRLPAVWFCAAGPDADGGTASRLRPEYVGPPGAPVCRSIADVGPRADRFAHGVKQRVEPGG